MIRTIDALVIGAGPAGLAAAIRLAEANIEVVIVDRRHQVGGRVDELSDLSSYFNDSTSQQRVQQLIADISRHQSIRLWLTANCAGLYEDGTALIDCDGTVVHLKPRHIVVATGSYEKLLAFRGNGLPGVLTLSKFIVNLRRGIVDRTRRILFSIPARHQDFFMQLIEMHRLNAVGIVHATHRESNRLHVPSPLNFSHHAIAAANGERHLNSVVIQDLMTSRRQTLATDYFVHYQDTLANGQLLWQRGCMMQFSEQHGCYLPAVDCDYHSDCINTYVIGDCAGGRTIQQAIDMAERCAARICLTCQQSENEVKYGH